MAKLDFQSEPCIIEYSEQQGMWHYNSGDNKVCSNGYEPVALGSFDSISSLVKHVHSEEGNRHLTLEEAWELVDKHSRRYDDVRMVILKSRL